MSDYILVKCRHCEKSTQFSLEAVQSEIKRLKTYNYEILCCQHCSRKFSREDFEKALGIGRLEEISKQLNCSTEELPAQLASQLPDLTNEQIITVIEKEKELQQKKEEELKKMQAGEPYDKEIVGPVDMEEGTPQDKRCVRILKKEGEIYGYTINVLDSIATRIADFFQAIWELIKKINWCIVCSLARIGYFIAYIGFVIYSIIALALLNFPSINIPNIWNNWLGAIIILVIGILPITLQLTWVFTDRPSRWAKVIQKRASEIIK